MDIDTLRAVIRAQLGELEAADKTGGWDAFEVLTRDARVRGLEGEDAQVPDMTPLTRQAAASNKGSTPCGSRTT